MLTTVSRRRGGKARYKVRRPVEVGCTAEHLRRLAHTGGTVLLGEIINGDKECEQCGSGDDEEAMLLCDRCNAGTTATTSISVCVLPIVVHTHTSPRHPLQGMLPLPFLQSH